MIKYDINAFYNTFRRKGVTFAEIPFYYKEGICFVKRISGHHTVKLEF